MSVGPIVTAIDQRIEDLRVLREFLALGAARQAAVDKIINHSAKGAAKDVGPVNAGTAAPKKTKAR